MNVILPSTSMNSKPLATSMLETECLFGENVDILEEYLEWVYCKLLTDGYCGWVKKNSLGYLKKPTHRVISKRTFVFKKKNVKSNCIHYLPMGALLFVKEIKKEWAEIHLLNNNEPQTAFVPSKHIVLIDNKTKDWVSVAEQLVGLPYKWGGRDTMGIDCSALLQLSYQTYGRKIPRNTFDQANMYNQTITDLNKLKRGFVVFWEGHVGIMVDRSNCIHANAFHMKTIIEPLNDIIIRMKNESQIIKIVDLN
jgi:hypothetical protein